MDPILAQIILWSGTWVPAGWLPCDGRLLPISGNEALFSLISNIYGGDGRSNFGLPDLRGRVPLSAGVSKTTGTMYTIGQQGGTEEVVLTTQQLAEHNHIATATSSGGVGKATLPNLVANGTIGVSSAMAQTTTPSSTDLPSLPYFGAGTPAQQVKAYGPADGNTEWPVDVRVQYEGGSEIPIYISNIEISGIDVSYTGVNEAHENRPPFLVMTYIIAVEGVYPPRP